jgi:HEAT repeat protein
MRRTLGLIVVLGLAAGAAQAQKKDREPTVNGKTVAAWVKVLERKEGLPRLQAINSLSQAGPEARKAAPALVAVFRDKDATFLHPLAAVALARIGPDALPELQKGLADKADAVKGASALALGLMGPQAKGATTALSKSLTDKTAAVRFASAQALGRIGAGAKAALPALRKALEDDDDAVRTEAAASLWKVAEEKRGLDVLVKSLDDKSARVAQSAISTLGEMGAEAKSAADALKKVAEKDKEPARRIQAAEAWYRVSGDAAALAVVTEVLADKDADVRRAAVAALGTFGAEEKAAEALTKLLADKDATIRREAACALAERGVKVNGALLTSLLAKLSDPDPGVRWWSALAVVASDAAVRKHEEELLRALRTPFRGRVGEKETPPWTTIQETAAPAGQRATAALIAVLKDRPSRFKQEATRLLGLLGMDARAAQPALLEALKGDKLLRRGAADALGQTGPEMVPTLIGLLSNSDARVREGAARALGQIGLPARSAVKALTAALKDDETTVKVQAALAIWNVDVNAELALPTLNLVFKNVDNADRWEAVEGIGLIAVEARPVIKGLLDVLLNAVKDREPAVKVQGVRWLFRRSGRARETATLLHDAVTDRNDLVRLMAVETLGETGAEGKVVELLCTALEDKDVSVRLAAEEALARGGKDMVPQLIEGLKDKRPRVRAGVARALGLIGPDAKEALKPLAALKDDKDAAVKAAVAEALGAIDRGKAEDKEKR